MLCLLMISVKFYGEVLFGDDDFNDTLFHIAYDDGFDIENLG